jgi:hypothetical protein
VLPAVPSAAALTASQLFGEEIVLMLIGLSWPPLTGMAIGAAGMLLGELAAFLLCKSLLRARAARYEARNLEYALVAHVIRSGGLVVAVLVRYSLLSDPRAYASSRTSCGRSRPRSGHCAVRGVRRRPRHVRALGCARAPEPARERVRWLRHEAADARPYVALSRTSALALMRQNRLDDPYGRGQLR